MTTKRTGRTTTAILAAAALALGAATAMAQSGTTPPPSPWPDHICGAGETTDCWVPARGVVGGTEVFISDSSGDSSPSNGDLYDSGTGAPTLYYAYSPAYDTFYFRMRLLGTPTLATNHGNPPGLDPNGAFSSNTAWNFILDTTGDGYANFLAQVDGNTGKQKTPFDVYRLAFNDAPTQLINDDSNCLAGGQVLTSHRANVVEDVAVDGTLTVNNADSCTFTDDTRPTGQFNEGDGVSCTFWGGAVTLDGELQAVAGGADLDLVVAGCTDELDPVCDFGYTRVVHETGSPADEDFFLDQQHPRGWFDSCAGADTDGDGVGGDQVVYPDTPFAICATTSTQPNDYTSKDIAYGGAFSVDPSKPLPCGAPCTLTGGCYDIPSLTVIANTCGSGRNFSPVHLSANVVDAGTVDANGDVVSTVDWVKFSYRPKGSTGWTDATPDAGSANPVYDPDAGTINTFSMDWDTTGLDPVADGTDVYEVRVEMQDTSGNYRDYGAVWEVDVVNCSNATSFVSLASFQSERVGRKVRFTWTTSTEAGNAGFNLYAKGPRGFWRKLNDELIPARAFLADGPQTYIYEAEVGPSTEFAIEDVDIRGQRRLHGPFRLGETRGRAVAPRPIDWAGVREELRREGRGGLRVQGIGLGRASSAGAEAEILVDRDGIYRVTYEMLRDAGVDLGGVRAADLALTLRGRAVPIRVGGPAAFGPGSYVEFFGEAARSLYTDTNVYRLSADPRQAVRAAVDPARPRGEAVTTYLERRRFERDRGFSIAAPTDDPWYDTWAVAYTSPKRWDFPFTVDELSGGGEAAVTVSLWTVTDWTDVNPDHHLVVRVNGETVGERWLDGKRDVTFTAAVADGLLREGENTLTLELPGDTGARWDVVAYDGLEVTYPRRMVARDGSLRFRAAGGPFRVEGFDSRRIVAYRLEGDVARSGALTFLSGTTAVASEWGWAALVPGSAGEAEYVVTDAPLAPKAIRVRQPAGDLASGRTDYVVVTHPALADALDDLVAARERQGLRVRVVTVDEVYDRYSGGIVDAGAIRAFVRDAVNRMGARYVLLAGGDTYDYLDRLGTGAMSHVPSLWTATDPIVTYAPVDSLYGDVDGDGVQDVAVGRLPARTPEEMRLMVAKTLAYEEGSGRHAAVASDSDTLFARHARTILRTLTGWSATTAFLSELPVEAARERLVGAINSGARLTAYVGHSGTDRWTFEGLFAVPDVELLTNAGAPTLVMQWGCWNVFVQSPTRESLGHALLAHPGGGAAAALGASTLTEEHHNAALSDLLTPALVRPGTTVGEALVEAKRRLAAEHPEYVDVLLGWNLLGDPALAVAP